MVCHEDLPDAQHSDHHGVVLEADHADDARSCPAGEVSEGTVLGRAAPRRSWSMQSSASRCAGQGKQLAVRNCLFSLLSTPSTNRHARHLSSVTLTPESLLVCCCRPNNVGFSHHLPGTALASVAPGPLLANREELVFLSLQGHLCSGNFHDVH